MKRMALASLVLLVARGGIRAQSLSAEQITGFPDTTRRPVH